MREDGATAKVAAGFDALVAGAGEDPRKLAGLARLARTIGRADQAYALAARARALAPGSAEIAALTQQALAGEVPAWHVGIAANQGRNHLYDAAIRRAVRPGDTVLDIGAGTGLLAMMAARAGAARVVSCEGNPALADLAREVVAANGFADRVTVIPKLSTALDVAADLGGPVDLLVSEIVSNNVLGQGVLPTMRDAVARLLKPGGRMVPLSAAAMVALAELPEPVPDPLADAAGFDVTALRRLEGNPRLVKTDAPGLALRSAPAMLFDFDFATGGPAQGRRASVECLADGGRVTGVAQWLRLRLDAETVHDAAPGLSPPSAWATLYHRFPAPLSPAMEAPVIVHGAHDDLDIQLWVDRP